MNMPINLYYFESGKESNDPINIYKDQLYIVMKKEKLLNFISNIIKESQNSDHEDDDTFLIGLAGEIEKT